MWRICRIEKVGSRRLIDDQRSPLTGLGTAWQGSLYILDENGLRLNHNLIEIRRPIFLASEQASEGGADPRGPPDMTAQSTTPPGAVPPHR